MELTILNKTSVLLITVMAFCAPLNVFAQDYREWEEHDTKRFYQKIDLESYTLDDEGNEIDEVYVPTKLEDGVYEVTVKKISSKLYQVQGTDLCILFQFNPFLFTHDDGILVVSYGSGTFYEEP